MDDAVAPPLPAGTIVAERYRVIGHLGAGGMGTVYEVEHTMMAKRFALKLLRPELSKEPTVAERFEREALSAARLDHPLIVRISDFGKAPDGALFMVMERVDGPPLSERLKKKGHLTVDQSLILVDQVLTALAHAHAHGVVHRDIKPANIMVLEGPALLQVKLLDFGIAKITAGEGPEASLTQMGMVIGTPRYMSPEQASAEPVDARTDLYSVGVLLFELLTGRAPFEGTSSVEILTKHLTHAPPPLVVEGLPSERVRSLQGVLHKALAKQTDARFQTADAFRDALEGCREGRAPRDTSGAWARRHARWLAAGAGAIALVCGIAVFGGASEPTLIENAEAAIARGDLTAARAMVIQALAADPDDAEAHLLEATIALAEDKAEVALGSMQRAVTLDPKLGADPRVSHAIRAQVSLESKLAPAFLALGRDPQILAELARTAPKPGLRREAYVALEKLSRLDSLDDRYGWLEAELKAVTRQSCSTRKWYAEQLIALGDARAVPILKKELHRKGGFLDLKSESQCMASELRAFLKAHDPN